MDGAKPSRFPHFAWLHFTVAGDSTANPLVVNTHGACHSISLTARGHHDVRWITRGSEKRWSESVGAVHFVPADDEHHTFVTSMSIDFVSEVLLLPRRHLDACLVSEEMEPLSEYHRLLCPNDAVLRACVAQVAAVGSWPDGDMDGRCDEAARRLILRILELCGGGTPDWRDDQSIFDRRTLAGLVGYINAHLRVAPTLNELAMRVGLSPSYFAKKFRQSTGLSLHRFINRQRVNKSLELLKGQSSPIAAVALDLGFSSQSHFTHLFSHLTGMTPARYRKQFRRTVG